MARALLTNNATSTLASGINTSVTSMTVGTGHGALFPTVGSHYFYVTLAEGSLIEIVKVTARSSDNFTIVRAQDGTTAQTFTTAATVKLNLTAAVMAEFSTLTDTETLTNKTLTGAALNGTLGATTPSTASVTTLAASSTVSGAGFTARFATPGPIGDVTPSTGAFTTLSATGTISAGTTNGTVQATNGTLTLASTGGNDIFVNVGTGRQTIFRANGTEVARITSSGAVCLAGGSTAPGGTGITFPATQSASSDANTLDDYREATATLTATGMTTAPTGTATFVKNGNIVEMEIPAISGTSNATTFTLTGIPTAFRPSATRIYLGIRAQDNGAFVTAVTPMGFIDTGGAITLYKDSGAATWTGSGTKGTAQCTISYII